MSQNKRRCGECRKPGHTRATCPKAKRTSGKKRPSKSKPSPRARRVPKKIDHAMGVRRSIDKALAAYVGSLKADQRPDQVTVSESILEYALDALNESHESAGLCFESILPRLTALNSEWANDDRAELRDLAADAAASEEGEEWQDDDDDDDDEDDDGQYGGIQWGSVLPKRNYD